MNKKILLILPFFLFMSLVSCGDNNKPVSIKSYSSHDEISQEEFYSLFSEKDKQLSEECSGKEEVLDGVRKYSEIHSVKETILDKNTSTKTNFEEESINYQYSYYDKDNNVGKVEVCNKISSTYENKEDYDRSFTIYEMETENGPVSISKENKSYCMGSNGYFSLSRFTKNEFCISFTLFGSHVLVGSSADTKYYYSNNTFTAVREYVVTYNENIHGVTGTRKSFGVYQVTITNNKFTFVSDVKVESKTNDKKLNTSTESIGSEYSSYSIEFKNQNISKIKYNNYEKVDNVDLLY